MQATTSHVFGQQARLLKQAQQHWEHGLTFSRKNEWNAAIKAFEKACKANPQDTLYRLNLARAFLRAKQPEAAITHTQRILEQEPRNVLARQLMGECLTQVGRHGEAASVMLDVPDDVKPSVEYLQILGHNLFNAQRYQEGIRVLFDALALDVTHAMSHYRLGLCFNALGMKAEAIECLTTALALDLQGGELAAHSLVAFMRRELCQWDQAEVDLGITRNLLRDLKPTDIRWSSVFAVVTLTDDAELQLRSARACANFFADGIRPFEPLPVQPLPARLRVGMVSCDFHHHATTILMAELLEKMDKSRFELSLYSHGPDDGSAMRDRIKAVADRFVEIGDIRDEEAARRIRADHIDILIDLKGHTINGRLGIFAYRPAPVQVTYLGFPGTSGASYIDYLIGDAEVSPLGDAHFYTEKLAHLPHCYQPNDRKRPLPQAARRADHGLPDDALVLCGFNQPFKLSPDVFDVWCDLLHRLPRAVLWLLQWNDASPEMLRAEARKRGIDPQRLVFARKVHISEHISRFALADIYLDAWPCNGQTTASDALWAGVPVVTNEGESFAQRVAASLLRNVGQPGLICEGVEAYRQKVLELAGDPAQRDAIRSALVRARDDAPLFDSEGYARDFSALLWRMAERHAQGLPPDHLV
jgi:predicted O-linked N-acetylglucosamine transferase (SPINDLY family)